MLEKNKTNNPITTSSYNRVHKCQTTQWIKQFETLTSKRGIKQMKDVRTCGIEGY